MSSVVVTGGAGRLGRPVVTALQVGHDVVSVDLAATGSPAERRIDVLDLDAMRSVVSGADAVVHLAGLDYDVHASATDVVRVNALGTWTVLRACVDAKVPRAIVCSSVAALGLHERRPEAPPRSLPVDDSHPRLPVEPYSVSKQVVEVLAEAVARSGAMDVLCIRPVAVVFPDAIEQFLATVDESLPSLFDYVTAADVAQAIVLAVDGDWSGYDSLLLSAADSAHPEPTLDWYRRLVGPLPPDTDQKVYDDFPRASIYSTRRATVLLGWEPTSTFADIRAVGVRTAGAGTGSAGSGSRTGAES